MNDVPRRHYQNIIFSLMIGATVGEWIYLVAYCPMWLNAGVPGAGITSRVVRFGEMLPVWAMALLHASIAAGSGYVAFVSLKSGRMALTTNRILFVLSLLLSLSVGTIINSVSLATSLPVRARH